MKLIVGNSERLVGMVAQFDTNDKGFLSEKDLVRLIAIRPLIESTTTQLDS